VRYTGSGPAAYDFGTAEHRSALSSLLAVAGIDAAAADAVEGLATA
jgi:hypothetical protein